MRKNKYDGAKEDYTVKVIKMLTAVIGFHEMAHMVLRVVWKSREGERDKREEDRRQRKREKERKGEKRKNKQSC